MTSLSARLSAGLPFPFNCLQDRKPFPTTLPMAKALPVTMQATGNSLFSRLTHGLGKVARG